jgi:hypothetical protein
LDEGETMTDRGKIKISEHQAYMSSKNGPFRCDNCEYYVEPRACNNDKVMGWARDGKYGLSLNSNELAVVDPGGCSDEFKKK